MRRCVEWATSFASADWVCFACGFTPRSADEILRFSEPTGSDSFNPQTFDVLAEFEDELLWSPTYEYAQHKRRYRRGELTEKVSAAGFVIRRVTSFVTLLLPAVGRVLDLERALISGGRDLRAGSSLVLVAMRT